MGHSLFSLQHEHRHMLIVAAVLLILRLCKADGYVKQEWSPAKGRLIMFASVQQADHVSVFLVLVSVCSLSWQLQRRLHVALIHLFRVCRG